MEDTDFQLMMVHSGERTQALLALGRFAGTRISEAVARTWGDVDFVENKVNIHNQYYCGEFLPPKSDKRRFGLFPELKEVLLRWRNITPYPDDTDLIFMGENGKPMSTHNWSWNVYKLQLVQGLRLNDRYTYYSLRHRFYTWLLDIGFSERDALYMLGDKTAPMVRRTYDHPTGDHLQEKIKQTQVFNEPSPDKTPEGKCVIIDIQDFKRKLG